jgi:hypothetical protein
LLHRESILYSRRSGKRLERRGVGNATDMLRKVMWTGLAAGLGAAASLASRRLASQIWRVATGEEPPTKK